MNDNLFDELVQSVREGGAILRGEKEAARTFEIDAIDIKNIREEYGLSQSEFAGLLGISVNTLQNWEQGHRTPQGPAASLLRIVDKEPEAALKAIHG